MEDKYILCPTCGKTLSSAYNFCGYCGSRIQLECYSWIEEKESKLTSAQEAARRTKEAENALSGIDNTLRFVFGKDCKVNWNELKEFSKNAYCLCSNDYGIINLNN